MIVSSQRATVHATTKAVPATGAWPLIAEPIEAPKTISTEAAPPSTTVANISGNARSRLAANLRSTGTS